MRSFCKVCQHQLALLLAAAIAVAADPSHNLASERTSIESTYELTKYLEYQLKEIKDVYLTYLGPPFNEKDFSPPRPNSTALTLPSAATRLELWHGLENQARLAQNQKAYSVLLAAVRELARSTLCPSLKTSLLHFCTGLDGLLGSISALMTSLGYTLPPQAANMRSDGGELQYQQRGTGGSRPAPLINPHRFRSGSRTESGQRGGQRRNGAKVARGESGDSADMLERRRGREWRSEAAGGRNGGSRERVKGERSRREKREESGLEKRAEEEERSGAVERWGRRLMSVDEDEDARPSEMRIRVSYLRPASLQTQTSSHQFSFNLNAHPDALRPEDGFILDSNRRGAADEETETDASSSASVHYQHVRPPRSLHSPTLQPPLSTFSLLYQIGGEEHTLLSQPVPLSLRRGTSLLSPPLNPLFSPPSSSASLLSARPTMNDFARKVEGFWILRELQSWLWRSAKDFNRLKKRLRG